ncbi:MAG: uracil-DNA glycosylase family protein [Bacteroidia bacterium]
MNELLADIKKCVVCEPFLEMGCRPVMAASPKSKIAIIGQAPGRRVHLSGIPWDDPSGDTLRKWLGVDKDLFYNPDVFAIVPMGFCYPGTGKSGDLPPRPECAPLWHQPLLEKMQEVELTLLIGAYAQKQYLKKEAKRTLTETVRNFNTYLPQFLPLPHPSPRNNIWMKKNPWFKEEVLPMLGETVGELLDNH